MENTLLLANDYELRKMIIHQLNYPLFHNIPSWTMIHWPEYYWFGDCNKSDQNHLIRITALVQLFLMFLLQQWILTCNFTNCFWNFKILQLQAYSWFPPILNNGTFSSIMMVCWLQHVWSEYSSSCLHVHFYIMATI